MSPSGVRAMARRTAGGEVAPDHFLREALGRAASDGGKRLHAFLALAGAASPSDPDPRPSAEGAGSPPPRGAGPSAQESAPDRGGGPPGLLAGVPVAVKDNLSTSDLPTTCGSRMLEGYLPPYDATVVRRLRAAGGRVLGKTNMDEFSMGSSTENSAFGPTLNPVARGRVPGGSSGGSAAAVAAGIVPCALGSDTGGSVRQPAAFCGVVGIKPTYGRVSRYGLVAFASSLDQVGTLGRTVEDAALLLQAVAGHDPRDATSSRRPVPDLRAALEEGEAPPDGLTIGVPDEYLGNEIDPGVRKGVQRALGVLEEAGARTVSVSLPHTGYAIPAYYVLAPAEASSNLARFDGIRYGPGAPGADSTRAAYEEARSRGFGPEVVRRILLGTFVLSAGYHERYYARAQAARRRVTRDFERVWDGGVDLLLAPTSPTPPFELGERAGDPLAMYLSDAFTVTANLAGIPALSLPVGTVGGLPVGAQLLAPKWKEARMVRAARCLERLLAEGTRA